MPSQTVGRTHFPKTLAAVKTAESDQWAIGDALVREIGRPPADGVNDGSRVRLGVCATELKQRGFSYSEKRLGTLRQIAAAFGPADRRRAPSFSACEEAHTPDVLNVALEQYDKPTKDQVADVRKAIIAEQKRKVQEEKNRRADEAERKRQEAEEARLADAEDAAIKEAEAIAAETAAKTPPDKKPKVEREEIEPALAYYQFCDLADDAEDAGKKAWGLVDAGLDEKTEFAYDRAMEVVNEWQKVASALQAGGGGRRLTAVA